MLRMNQFTRKKGHNCFQCLVLQLALHFLWSSSCSAKASSSPPNIQSLLDHLKTSKKDPNIWRRLGKIMLDAGEYAEARRIFCQGSSFCPLDQGLLHHVKVWDAFHSDEKLFLLPSTNTITPLAMPTAHDLFLSLDTAPHVPLSVQQWPGPCAPLHRTKLIYATRDPILSREACTFLIDAACQVANERGGWTKDRHQDAPTCDIPAHELPLEAQRWIRNAFHTVLFPSIIQAFQSQLELKDLCIQDCFVVRYDGIDGPGFPALKPHQDESLISITIALNNMNEYEGGGLFIASTGDLLNGDAGTVMCFAGGLVHGGYPVSKGTRWILTAFLYADSNQSRKPPGYTLRGINLPVDKND